MCDERHFEATFQTGEHTGILKIGDETIRVYLTEISGTHFLGDLYFDGNGWIRRQKVIRTFVLVEDV